MLPKGYFPILYSDHRLKYPLVGLPLGVRDEFLTDPYIEKRCQENHDQSVKRLKERGGLTLIELLAVFQNTSFQNLKGITLFEAAIEIISLVGWKNLWFNRTGLERENDLKWVREKQTLVYDRIIKLKD